VICNVRFGSLTAATALILGVRFAPESCRDNRRPACPLRAISGRRASVPLHSKRPADRDQKEALTEDRGLPVTRLEDIMTDNRSVRTVSRELLACAIYLYCTLTFSL
jgi:hypothetical protein